MNDFTDTQRLDFVLKHCGVQIPILDAQQGIGDFEYDRATVDAAMHVWQNHQREITTKRRHELLSQKARIEAELAKLQ